MGNITDWVKNELYPSLFWSIDRALPEFDFKRKGRNWISSNRLKITGEQGDSIGKVYVWETAPGFIKDFTRDTSSIVSYVMQRDGVEFIQAVKTLAEVAGIQLPEGDFSQESYQRHRDQATLLEDCNGYLTYCLETSPGAEEVRAYLQSRGYKPEDIVAMELGYIPSQDKLFKYLEGKGYSQTLIEETVRIKTDTRIGSTHSLTIPYRSGGSVKGFKFRTIGDATPKYINSSGLDRMGGFFNLLPVKGDKDIVIVEGELDSLSATVKGVENVVATGGSSISPEQIRDALKRGAKSFTLCFDREPGKEEETAKKVSRAIEVILGEGVNRVYVVTLPALEGIKTDTDSLIRERGVESFKTAIAQALPYYEYKLQAILHRYGKIEEEGGLQPKDIDNLLEEVIDTGDRIPDAIQRDLYKKLFTSLEVVKELGITQESYEIAVDKLTSTREKEAQGKALKALLSEAKELPTEKALGKIETSIQEIKAITGRGLLPSPMSFTSLMDEIASTPIPFKTGYRDLDKFIGFTPGTVTLIAGRPSHGKTSLLYNLLLQMSSLYKDRSFYYFTYEEPVANLSIKLINRLTATDLGEYFREYPGVITNYDFIKAYIKAKRTDILQIEEGKGILRELIDSQRIKIADRSYSVEELYRVIAYLSKRERIGAILIDYVQRMRTERETQDIRTQIVHISDGVLQIAKDTNLPVIMGSQLNRAMLTSGGSKKPTLENLKESGSLEEDANTVLSIYNESREKDETPEGESYKSLREVELEIKVLKNREGDVNQVVNLTFDKWTGVIRDSKNW